MSFTQISIQMALRVSALLKLDMSGEAIWWIALYFDPTWPGIDYVQYINLDLFMKIYL